MDDDLVFVIHCVCVVLVCKFVLTVFWFSAL